MQVDFFSDPVFGVMLTLAGYFAGLIIYKKTGSMLLHPMLTSMVMIITVLMVSGIDYETYNEGGQYITFLLGPATVALAIPMYRQIELLKKNIMVILSSTIFISVCGILLVIFLGLITGADSIFIVSAIPKSVTTPIAVGITRELAGKPSLTVSLTLIHGLLGGMFGPCFLYLFGIKTKMARGLTMGMLSHGLGTARALDEDEYEGALAGLAIGLMGFFTAVFAPVLAGLIL